jgi:hypothetical protein
MACDFDIPMPLTADFTQPELARSLNALAPAALARGAAALGALLVHYSTGYVFDGSSHSPRDEQAPDHSCSRADVLRGLHCQLPPHAQGKLVRVVKGRAWAVTVELRSARRTAGNCGFRPALRPASWRWRTTRISSTRPPASTPRSASAACAGTIRCWPSPGR